MRRGTRSAGGTRRGVWRNAVVALSAFVLILTPGPGLAAQGGGGGEEPTEEAGNNLSMPVIWADIAGPTLRGDGSQTYALPDGAAHVTEGSEVLFLQQDPLSTWQAENIKLADSAALPKTETGLLALSYVDWGDNLESKDWSTKQKIRVETRLMQDVSALPDQDPVGTGMTGFDMSQVGATTGPDEMWGVVATGASPTWVATLEQRTEAFAYTGYACVTIEKVDGGLPLLWDATTRSWTGTPAVASCLGEGADGPGSYGAEVTISGGLTYGYVWDPKGLPDGEYRMTFSLGAKAGVDFVTSTTPYVTVSRARCICRCRADGERGGRQGERHGHPARPEPQLPGCGHELGLPRVHREASRRRRAWSPWRSPGWHRLTSEGRTSRVTW